MKHNHAFFSNFNILSLSSSSQPFMTLLTVGIHNSRHALLSWATLIHWLLPTSSMFSLHLFFGSSSYSFSFSRCPFWLFLGPPGDAQPGYMSCPLFSHALHSLYYIFHHCLDLITSFRILSFFVMFDNNISMLRWATASFFSWCFVRPHVSAP